MIQLAARHRSVAAMLLFALCAAAEASDQSGHACGQNERWDNPMSMCMPAANAGTALTVLSGRFYAFGVFSAVPGPRGIDQFAAPNMFMIDVGRTIGARQFVNLELMSTTELWTYPQRGYPELLQIGEQRSDGTPYIDAQHPHSSPIMGLTLSDTITLDSAKTLKVFFAPRGESTDGPIAYMHRESARDNPDAPLGHHVGQDVGHISSTVLGAQLDIGTWIIEASAFNGTEPEPTHVDLPIGPLNSEALRVTYVVAMDHRVMASVAHVEQTDPQYPGTTSATRLSASLYDHWSSDLGTVDHTLVVGSIGRHPDGESLNSVLDEAVLQRGRTDLWGRVEVLQRLGSELEIPGSPPAEVGSSERRWVSAYTLGFTHWFAGDRSLQVGFGAALTLDVIPADWATAYGNRTPVTGRLIVQVRGSGRWSH
jgi:hypothetical protein